MKENIKTLDLLKRTSEKGGNFLMEVNEMKKLVNSITPM